MAQAIANDKTKWPKDYDWGAAGVLTGDADDDSEPLIQHYSALDISITLEEEVLVLKLEGELDVYTAPKLRRAVILAVYRGYFNLIFDLNGLDFLDSAGLPVLVGALKRVRNHDGRVLIRCSDDRILRIFRITGLSKVFPVIP